MNGDFFILVLIQMSSKYSCVCFTNLSWVVKWLFPVEAKCLSSSSLSEVSLVNFTFISGSLSCMYLLSHYFVLQFATSIYSFIYFSLKFRISGYYLFVYNVFVLFFCHSEKIQVHKVNKSLNQLLNIIFKPVISLQAYSQFTSILIRTQCMINSILFTRREFPNTWYISISTYNFSIIYPSCTSRERRTEKSGIARTSSLRFVFAGFLGQFPASTKSDLLRSFSMSLILGEILQIFQSSACMRNRILDDNYFVLFLNIISFIAIV